MFNLWKAHGLGNDYLVWQGSQTLDSNIVQHICHRHTGVGSDGILEPFSSTKADMGVTIWNPDGSIAEKSGNGLRIFAWWCVVKKGLFPNLTAFTVDTGFDVVRCVVCEAEGWVQVEMGVPKFGKEEIPTTQSLWAYQHHIEGAILELYAVSMGNPHCMALFDSRVDLDALPWRKWGEHLEVHPFFPNRSNIQFAKILSRDRIEIRIWERGAGETSASGSSSCAVAAICHRLGLIDDEVRIEMPGGVLEICFDSDGQVILKGAVTEIASIQFEHFD